MRRKPWGFPKRRWRSGKRRSRPISRVLSWTVIPLGATSPLRSSNLPGPDAGRAMRSLFGLAPGGVCRAGLLPDSRCALTAPFQPYLIPCGPSAVSFCCTFRRLAPPRRYLAPCPVEPGLSSALFPMTRLSGRLRHLHCRTAAQTLRSVAFTTAHAPACPRTASLAPASPSASDRPSARRSPPPPPPHRQGQAPPLSTAGRRGRPAAGRPPQR